MAVGADGLLMEGERDTNVEVRVVWIGLGFLLEETLGITCFDGGCGVADSG